ncbi:endocuticle structural glycoprotein SgAbd-5-like [Toxorhynchites rutilus septentrionalis]|uniref:endocuticle structural glycoprotein SgAbd-5-like n=1 Tax=Toxorhynchites rutilus septentrionalis TaxID=329112 RepID=UPI002479B995|nr:endocuticle structural glycoprotein SgAbd-5-like [Toxorhynchites rutilus septentrionalis]
MAHSRLLSVFCLIMIIMVHGQNQQSERKLEISVDKLINDHDVDGYRLLYLLTDGQFREERGFLRKQLGSNEMIWTVNGRYGYKSPEGKQFNYEYTADENGYRQISHGLEREATTRIDPKELISLVG